MRFSLLGTACVLMFAPGAALAQDDVPAEASPAAEAPPAGMTPPLTAPEPPSDETCAGEVTPALLESFGEPVAWPIEGQTVHRPTGVEKLGHGVRYVLVKRRADGAVDEVGYRLEGMERTVGEAHDSRLLRDFDKEFSGAQCGKSEESACGVIYEPGTHGKRFTGAEIGSGEIDIGSGARGPELALIEADYDLLDTVPVFLVCFYRDE